MLECYNGPYYQRTLKLIFLPQIRYTTDFSEFKLAAASGSQKKLQGDCRHTSSRLLDLMFLIQTEKWNFRIFQIDGLVMKL